MKSALYVICVLSLLAGFSHQSIAETDQGYCPVKDFVDFCLAPIQGFEDADKWATFHNWSSKIIHPVMIKKVQIYKPKIKNFRGFFSLKLVEYSDVSTLYCAYISFPHSYGTSSTCNTDFPEIKSVIPTNAQSYVKKTDRGAARYLWKYEHGNFRYLINTLLSKDNRLVHLKAAKTIIKK